MSLLISSVLWCPPAQPKRIQSISEHLSHLEKIQCDFPGTRFHLVINDEPAEEIIEAVNRLESRWAWDVDRFSPQIGWARGRNLSMAKFESSPCTRLAMMDCDITYADTSWAKRVLELEESDPELIAYMIRPDKWQLKQKARLKSGTIVDIYPEWLGTTNVIGKEVLGLVGGLNHEDFPAHWGFHDCEWGRRLKKSGALDPVKGLYVDPVRIEGDLGHDDSYNKFLDPMKNDCIAKYASVFYKREAAIARGERIWLPYAQDLV